MTARTVVYSRDALYEQVWREPATKVARRYSISSVALGKICRQLCVPVPGRGYWAQHAFGKAPQKPALPPMSDRKSERRVTRRTTVLDRERVADSHANGKAAAAALLGQEKPFTATPWFWSDQHGRKLQMAGLATGATQSVLRGDTAAASFSVWHYAGDRLIAVDTVDEPRTHLLARKLLDAGLSPTPAEAADAGFDAASLLAR